MAALQGILAARKYQCVLGCFGAWGSQLGRRGWCGEEGEGRDRVYSWDAAPWVGVGTLAYLLTKPPGRPSPKLPLHLTKKLETWGR